MYNDNSENNNSKELAENSEDEIHFWSPDL